MTGIPSNRFGKWLANNKGMKSVGHKISDFFTKKLPEARSRMLLEKLDDFLKERKERKEALRGLSPETIASIDDLKQQLDQLGKKMLRCIFFFMLLPFFYSGSVQILYTMIIFYDFFLVLLDLFGDPELTLGCFFFLN